MVVPGTQYFILEKFKVNIAIRTDASSAIGSGHLMRCLSLAVELRKTGSKIIFICASTERTWIELVCKMGFNCVKLHLSQNSGITCHQNKLSTTSSATEDFQFDWRQDLKATKNILEDREIDGLVVDHYGIDWRWELEIRPHTRWIMAIDDLADRKHECDIVLDCVYGRRPEDYQNLVPNGCRLLLGMKYALLRSEFSEWRSIALNRRKEVLTVRNILVSLGGVDKTNLTGEVLEILKFINWNSDCRIEVIAGKGFMHKLSVENQLASFPVSTTFETGVNDMAKRIANSDFGIGAFGMSTWERFCLGLPSVNIVTEENQRHAITALNKQKYSGIMSKQSIGSKLVQFVNQVVNDKMFYRECALWCSQSVDGKGLARVVKQIERT